MTSCASTSYYQVYKTSTSEKIKLEENSLDYEDQNCIISYNFWEDEGNIGFRFFNKTNQNIYLNLDDSFYILNGIANNYYKNRIFTNSQNSGVVVTHGATLGRSVSGNNFLNLLQTNLMSTSGSTGKVSSSATAVAYNEEKIICIPPQTAKIISEYNINQSLFRNCELLRYPTKKQIKAERFTKLTSPIIFSNIISFKIAQSETQNQIQNEFYVSEITNLPESEMYFLKYQENCGKKSTLKLKYFVEPKPNKFYIKYNSEQIGTGSKY
jgi:hypothetical protein